MSDFTQAVPPKRVLIAASSPILAKGLEVTLVSGGLEAPLVCSDIVRVHATFLSAPPAVAILESTILPGPNIIADLLAAAPRCRLLLLDRGLSQPMVEFISRTGACRILPSSTRPQDLLAAVKAALENRAPVPALRLRDPLSREERELIAMVSHGVTNHEIAALRGCPEQHIDRLLNGLMRRLDVAGRCELALYGISGAAVENSLDSEMPR